MKKGNLYWLRERPPVLKPLEVFEEFDEVIEEDITLEDAVYHVQIIYDCEYYDIFPASKEAGKAYYIVPDAEHYPLYVWVRKD